MKIIEAQAIESLKIFTIETGKKIRQKRQALKISIRKFAQQINMSISTISELEKGYKLPSLYMHFRITLALGIDDLFGQYNPVGMQKRDIVSALNSIGLTEREVQQVLKYIEFLRYESGQKWQYTIKEEVK